MLKVIKMKNIFVAMLVFTLFATGCASLDNLSADPNAPKLTTRVKREFKLVPDRFGEERLSEAISRNLRDKDFKGEPVIITTFVNLNDLEKSSVFGRLMAEKLLHYMNKNGFYVVEVRRSQDLFIKKSVGELILTRNISELANQTKAKSVLAGTYVATTNALIINARLIDINTPRILSSFSYEVEMTDEIENLLKEIEPF